MITITRQNVFQFISNNGGFNSAQLTVLGCHDSTRGWLQRLIGQQVTEEQWQLLIDLRGASKARQRELVPDRKPFFASSPKNKTPDRLKIDSCRLQFKMLLLCLKVGENVAAQDHARRIVELCS